MACRSQRALALAVVLGLGAPARASTDDRSRSIARVLPLSADSHRPMFASDRLVLSVPSLHAPRPAAIGLSVRHAPTVDERALPALVLDPRLIRWKIDALGGAWVWPTMTGSALVGRLLFRF